MTTGEAIYKLAARLFPICRSLTGDGNRETLRILSEVMPIRQEEVPTGTRAFDWTVPDEWNIRSGRLESEDGRTIADFSKNNLCVVGYSEPVDRILSLKELRPHLHSLPEQPAWIPYVTSYYKRTWGFCLPHDILAALSDGRYHAKIDSTLASGSLTYGEVVIPGKSRKEVFFSTYVCHPSMANNELSGPCTAVHLAKWIAGLPARKYTYRFAFVPETLGALVYLSRNLAAMKENVAAGFVLTCLGDDRAWSYVPSRKGHAFADHVALSLLDSLHPEAARYTFLNRGSDERQYCAPGVDLPVCSVMRSKYGRYPEYHTSADNMQLISATALDESFEFYKQAVQYIEENELWQAVCPGEPQLGKRGLYPTESKKGSADHIRNMMNFLAYADGTHDLSAISAITGIPTEELRQYVQILKEAGLIKEITEATL